MTNIRVVFAIFFCFTVAINFVDSKCFDTDKIKEDFKNLKQNWKGKGLAKVAKVCAEEHPENDDEANEKCAKEKISAAKEKCRDEEKSKMRECMKKELGMTNSDKSSNEFSYEKYEEKMLSYVVDDSKKAEIKSALEECKDQKSFRMWMCGMKKVSEGPCPEIKEYMEEMKKKFGQRKQKSE